MSILDGCDGEIARLKFLKSKWGGFFDAVIDKYVDTTIIAGMSYGYWINTQNAIILPISIFLMLTLILDGYMPNKYKVLTNKKLKSVNIFKRDTWLLVLSLGAITNKVLFTMIIMLLILNFKVIFRLVFARKMTSAVFPI